jgi:hypothetical protein
VAGLVGIGYLAYVWFRGIPLPDASVAPPVALLSTIAWAGLAAEWFFLWILERFFAANAGPWHSVDGETAEALTDGAARPPEPAARGRMPGWLKRNVVRSGGFLLLLMLAAAWSAWCEGGISEIPSAIVRFAAFLVVFVQLVWPASGAAADDIIGRLLSYFPQGRNTPRPTRMP